MGIYELKVKTRKDEDFDLWNSKYSQLANSYSKIRELESFIQTL